MLSWRHIDRPGGYRLSIKPVRDQWRVIVWHEATRRAYVAGPDEYMDSHAMAVQWAHIVYNSMRSSNDSAANQAMAQS